MSVIVTLVFLLVCLGPVLMYPTGAPTCTSPAPDSFADFSPAHGTTVDDQSLPYFVNATKSGKDWTVMIWGEDSYFKGFLLRAMPVNSSDTVKGSYITIPQNTQNCSETDATHTSADVNHTALTFVWRQSDEMSGDVYFKATIVHSKSTNYKITTSLPPGIAPDPECGSMKGCLSDCNTSSCTYQITWKASGNLVRFEFQQLLGNGDIYQALGLSDDVLMGNDSVMVCMSSEGTALFQQGTNSPGPNSYYAALINPNDVTTVEVSQADGVIHCVVERPINSTDPKVYSLSEPLYALHAMGFVYPGGYIAKHTIATSTPSRVDFLSVTQPTTQPPASGISPDPECGESKGCQSSCSGGSCSYRISWQKRDDIVRFEMMEVMSGNSYQAIGFSSDDKMGEDSVMACKSSGGSTSFELGFNSGKSYGPLSGLTGTGVTVIETSQNSGVVRCVVDRPVNSTNSQVYSLTRTWYLLRATGPVAGGALRTHSFKASSSAQVDFLSASLVTEKEPDVLMVKLHGSFMMIAWVMFSSIGIITARFFKDGWEGKTIGGIKVWFQIHRTCMVSVFILTVAAFIIIFIDVGEYREVAVSDGRDYLKYHPILGIVVTALTVINPIMSLFRCGPNDKRRPLFNIAHFTVGTGAHILAAITVLFGMNIDRSNLSMDASYVMYAYMAAFVVIEIALELQRVCQKSLTSSNDVAVEMKSVGEKSEKSIQFERRPKIKKEMFLYLHVLLMAAFCVAMVVILIIS